MNRWKLGLIITGLFATGIVALSNLKSFHGISFLHSLERVAYDIRTRAAAHDNPDSRVVVIDLDEKSIAEQGQWPWPREKMATLVDQLFDRYNVNTLGMDIVFSEAQTQFSVEQVQTLLNDQRKQLLIKPTEAIQVDDIKEFMVSSGQDVLLSKSFENRKIVLGYFFEQKQSRKIAPSSGLLPSPFFDLGTAFQGVEVSSNAPSVNRYTANLNVLQKAAVTGGFFNLSGVEDIDGVIRRVSTLNEYKDKLYPSLAVRLLEQYSNEEALPVLENDLLGPSITQLLIGGRIVELGQDADVYVPYSSVNAVHKTISATDIITGRFSGDLSDKIAIVGTSAPGLLDLRSTPVASSYPGVYVHANTLDGFLNNEYLVKTDIVLFVDFLIAVLFGVLLSLLLPRMSVVKSSYLFLGIIITLLGLNFYAWSVLNIILSIAPVMLLVTFVFILNLLIGFFIETRSKQVMQSLFGLYVPPEVVTDLCEREDESFLRTQKRVMTVLFLDIRGFTTISESVDPEVVSEFLNQFFTKMTEIVHRHGGAVDKYMGDSLMAFWGAPLVDEKHADKAISAAIEMISVKEEMNQQFEQNGLNLPDVNYGIGINSGMMSVGNMGSKFRMAYTVVGDAVNLGSRIEGLTRKYNTNLIISEFSKELAPEFNYEKLDSVTVKGKSEQVTIFQCLGSKNN